MLSKYKQEIMPEIDSFLKGKLFSSITRLLFEQLFRFKKSIELSIETKKQSLLLLYKFPILLFEPSSIKTSTFEEKLFILFKI